MSMRMIPHGDMSADQLMACCSQAIAVLNLVHNSTWLIQTEADQPTTNWHADDIGQAVKLAVDRLEPFAQALQPHEGRAPKG